MTEDEIACEVAKAAWRYYYRPHGEFGPDQQWAIVDRETPSVEDPEGSFGERMRPHMNLVATDDDALAEITRLNGLNAIATYLRLTKP